MENQKQVVIGYTSDFARQIKRLKKKYPSMKNDFNNFLRAVEQNPLLGTDLGNGLRKVRLAIASKGKGKSGGARIITCILDVNSEELHVDLLTIYDKSEISNVSDTYIESLVNSNNSK